jgi:hypothetical protein
MATWKKVIVSGSSAALAALTLDTALTVANGGTGLTGSGTDNFLVGNGSTSFTTVGSNGSGTVVRSTNPVGITGMSATGSFTGSFIGTFVGTTDLPDLTSGNGLTGGPYDGSVVRTFSVLADGTTLAVSGTGVKVASAGITATELNTSVAGNGLSGGAGTALAVNVDNSSIEIVTDTLNVKALGITNAMLAGSIANAKLTNSSVTLGSTNIALGATATTLNALTLTNVSATGSFTGSFFGDGSGLTGLVSTLNIDSDDASPGTVDLLTQTLDIAGGTNITTTRTSQTITVNLDSNISVTDAIVTGDLTVYGTASFANTENLLVADRFVLFASGSTTTGDGGIVIQQGTQNVGELYGYDSSVTRWGVTSSFSADGAAFTPDAFMAAVVDIDAGNTDVARYQKNGNIKVDSGEIYIYS